MRFRNIAVVFITFFITASMLFGQTEEVAAVIDIVNKANLSDRSNVQLQACVRSQVVKSKRFITLEPDMVSGMLKEQKIRPDPNCVTNECLLKFGELVFAKKVIGGAIKRTGNLFEMNMKMVDVAEGKIVSSASVKTKTTVDELLKVHIPQLINKLFKNYDVKVAAKARTNKGLEPGQIPGYAPQAIISKAETSPPPLAPTIMAPVNAPVVENPPQTSVSDASSLKPIAIHTSSELPKASSADIKPKPNTTLIGLLSIGGFGILGTIYWVILHQKHDPPMNAGPNSSDIPLDPPTHSR